MRKEIQEQDEKLSERPVTQKFADARESLSPELRSTFDALCADVSELSVYFYGKKLISYSILRYLVEKGWKKLD
jgi:hypothetical protein